MLSNKIVVGILLVGVISAYVIEATLTLQELALRSYFTHRSLSVIKCDLENNRLNQDIQEKLVPLVINKYKKQLDVQFHRVFKNHTSWVTSVAVSQNGKYILTGSHDTTAQLLNVETGNIIKIFHHDTTVHSVALSSDGRYALTGSYSKTAYLWDIETGEVKKFRHADQVTIVALSPDGRYALTGSDDKIAYLWDSATGNIIQTFVGHRGAILSVAFSFDGHYVLTGSTDATARLWHIPTGETSKLFVGHVNHVTSVAISNTGSHILTGSFDGGVRLWDTTTGETIKMLASDKIKALCEPKVNSVALSPNGTQALIGSWNATHLWDLETGQVVQIVPGYVSPVTAVTFSRCGRYALTGSYDKRVRLWDLSYFQQTVSLKEVLDKKVNQFAYDAPCTIL